MNHLPSWYHVVDTYLGVVYMTTKLQPALELLQKNLDFMYFINSNTQKSSVARSVSVCRKFRTTTSISRWQASRLCYATGNLR